MPTPEASGEASGASLIAAERRRQIEVEGWTAEHDTAHAADDALIRAARAYLIEAENPCNTPPSFWPWHVSYFKPAGRLRNLVKAGALVAAEIDRLLAAGDAATDETPRQVRPPQAPNVTVHAEVKATHHLMVIVPADFAATAVVQQIEKALRNDHPGGHAVTVDYLSYGRGEPTQPVTD